MQSRATSMRTSDAERQRVAEFLRDACADGRLTAEELEERLDLLFAGSTVADIAELVRDLPGGSRVVPRLHRGAPPRMMAAAAVPERRARRRSASPAVPAGAALLVIGVVWLVAGALPPLLFVAFAAVALSIAVVFGLFAIALAPVGLALFAFGWIVQRLFRGPARPRVYGPPGGPWSAAGPRRRRHPFL